MTSFCFCCSELTNYFPSDDRYLRSSSDGNKSTQKWKLSNSENLENSFDYLFWCGFDIPNQNWISLQYQIDEAEKERKISEIEEEKKRKSSPRKEMFSTLTSGATPPKLDAKKDTKKKEDYPVVLAYRPLNEDLSLYNIQVQAQEMRRSSSGTSNMPIAASFTVPTLSFPEDISTKGSLPCKISFTDLTLVRFGEPKEEAVVLSFDGSFMAVPHLIKVVKNTNKYVSKDKHTLVPFLYSPDYLQVMNFAVSFALRTQDLLSLESYKSLASGLLPLKRATGKVGQANGFKISLANDGLVLAQLEGNMLVEYYSSWAAYKADISK